MSSSATVKLGLDGIPKQTDHDTDEFCIVMYLLDRQIGLQVDRKAKPEAAKILMLSQIRRFQQAEKTIAYAKMLESAGAFMVAVHGRTREQKTAKEVRADWDAIKVYLLPSFQ